MVMLRFQQVVDGHTELVGDLLQHAGVRDGLAPFPFGNSLVGVIQPLSQFQLCHAGGLAELRQVFRKNIFDVVHGYSRKYLSQNVGWSLVSFYYSHGRFQLQESLVANGTKTSGCFIQKEPDRLMLLFVFEDAVHGGVDLTVSVPEAEQRIDRAGLLLLVGEVPVLELRREQFPDLFLTRPSRNPSCAQNLRPGCCWPTPPASSNSGM